MELDWLTAEARFLLTQGIILTLVITFFTSMFAFVLGIAAGTARLKGNQAIKTIARIYIEIHRNIPALVLVIFWAFAVPNIFPQSLRQQIFFNNTFWNQISELTGIALPYYLLAGALGLTLNTSAYLAELFRAGVNSIPSEHIESARSLGANSRVVFWQVLLPSGVQTAFPAMSTRLIHNFKNTALLSLVAVPIFFHGIQAAISKTFRATEFLLLAAVVYLVLTAILARLLRSAENGLFPKRANG
ncbi:MAG: ABC transporter permease subunit [Chloroflexota bacterium]